MKFFSHGILGMNARNLKYIRAKNSVESISLADSKLKTKKFLGSRGIPFAQNYATINSYQELKDFSFDSIKTSGFVIKPNRGSGGRGILIVKREKSKFIVQDEEWTIDELKLHMTDILHGSFSLHGTSDTIIIEELLVPGNEFSYYCKHGLADIRIIVYNFVPITAMIRMPTQYSEGKANLAQGGIGLGLNIGDGQIISLFENKKVHVHTFPPEYESLGNRTLPFWDNILLLSSQVQMYTKLGYLALDWVITKDGPKLLEINARAGLEIQNVNLVPLSARLKKIEDLRILSPEKGVEIAKALFQKETQYPTSTRKTLHLKQTGTVGDLELTISVDLAKENSTVSEDVAKLALDGEVFLTTTSNINVQVANYDIVKDVSKQVILGRKDLEGYLINPTDDIAAGPTKRNSQWSTDILSLDQEIYSLGKKVNLSSILKPENYFKELDAFIQSPHGYNPIFSYRFPGATRVQELKDCAKVLAEKAQLLEAAGEKIAPLYVEKITEIEAKIGLLEAYRDMNYKKVLDYNTLLFGTTNDSLLQEAMNKVLMMKTGSKNDNELLGQVLTLDEIIEKINDYFNKHNIKRIPITIENGNLSRMSVSYGKEVKIHVSKGAIIHEKEIDPILAHEIGTHFHRYAAGEATGLKLFQYGTGFHLSDEEGLAIYRSFAHLPEGYEKNAMYIKYYLLSVADTLSFANTVELLISLYPQKPIETIFAGAVRLKRGIIYTETKGIEGTTYQKDKIYLDGYKRVQAWIDAGGNQNQLLFGKIKILDLPIIESLS